MADPVSNIGDKLIPFKNLTVKQIFHKEFSLQKSNENLTEGVVIGGPYRGELAGRI